MTTRKKAIFCWVPRLLRRYICGATLAALDFCGETNAAADFCGETNAAADFCGETNAAADKCGVRLVKKSLAHQLFIFYAAVC
jgi:hypothetical protein